MMKQKRLLAAALAGILALSLAACGSSPAPDEGTASPADTADTNEPAHGADSAAVPIDSSPVWETTVYEDEYLRYEIPANWVKDANNSNDEHLFAFFTPADPATDRPSNVNLAINSLENKSKDFDYSDPALQSDFHEYLHSEAGSGLPDEAADGNFTVYKSDKGYAYALGFDRMADKNTKVHQTLYSVMGLDYAITIWATDWDDGCSPTPEEVAQHICATIELK